MEAKTIRAGLGAALVAGLIGPLLGGFGGWSPVISLANNYFGSWIILVVFSILLAYVFGYLLNDLLPGTTIARGAIFGILVWILLLILGGVSAFFKDAVYPNPAGTSLFLSLLLHVIWGATLGLLYESK